MHVITSHLLIVHKQWSYSREQLQSKAGLITLLSSGEGETALLLLNTTAARRKEAEKRLFKHLIESIVDEMLNKNDSGGKDGI